MLILQNNIVLYQGVRKLSPLFKNDKFGDQFPDTPFRTAKENLLSVISYFMISFIYNLMISGTQYLVQQETVNIIQFSEIMCSLKILNQLNKSLFLQVIKSAFHYYLVITFLFALTIL